MTDYQMDLLIRDALLDAVGVEFNNEIHSDAMIPVSNAYRQKIQLMFDGATHTEKTTRFSLRKKCFRTFAGTAAACLLLFGAVMVTSPTARAAVQRWWVQQAESGWLSYIFTGEQRIVDLPLYEIQALPDGYTTVENKEFISSLYRKIVYRDETGQEIVLTYGDMFQGAELRLYTEDMEKTSVTVNGWQGTLLTSKNEDSTSYLVWMNDTAKLQFILEAPIDGEELLTIAESIVETSH